MKQPLRDTHRPRLTPTQNRFRFRLLSILALLLLGGNLPGGKILAAPPEKNPGTRVQIALLLDTSNSMDGLIDQAKATLWDLVNEFSYVRCRENRVPDLEIALYEYGNDGLSPREGFIRQVLPFSSDLDEISGKLFSLRTNGGEEFCGQVIQSAVKQLRWSRDARDLKFIFIAGNEPFNQGRTPYESVIRDAAEKDVVVNTIFCGDYRLGVNTLWADGARLGQGDYTAIDHNRAIVHVATPYDDRIIQLNKRLNKTYVAYGALGATRKQTQGEQDANAAEMEEAVMVERAVSKSSSFYRNESWDLVDAYQARKLNLEELNRKSLPGHLRELDTDGLRDYLEKQQEERAEIQEAIRQADARRKAYLAKHQTDSAEGLQGALLEAVRKQARRKAYTWVQ
ncbi:vWA domain-containing protein [Robiginitalea biformata]|uniref:VWFA domain-containing protein n=1 Tax=Robiginitalea biformata (strain ATCC BAA-864 / DSM 15991 / KCTC 12146 / HTCC2501) TaxID=313596 RepID=A4CG62_ROBBH|nr:vWA domain-containing protein [Robiginitalea biformata]EAR15920.1 hypothetical protein RB2501_03460 [Robiginitalea biformata HTCC2501]